MSLNLIRTDENGETVLRLLGALDYVTAPEMRTVVAHLSHHPLNPSHLNVVN